MTKNSGQMSVNGKRRTDWQKVIALLICATSFINHLNEVIKKELEKCSKMCLQCPNKLKIWQTVLKSISKDFMCDNTLNLKCEPLEIFEPRKHSWRKGL